jgi:nitrogen regulatory protein PII
MKRIEIIANHSVEDYIMELLEKSGIKAYTKVPVVYGRGNSNPKMGTSVWPEENFLLIVYTEEIDASVLKAGLAELKVKYQGEGIKYFEIG